MSSSIQKVCVFLIIFAGINTCLSGVLGLDLISLFLGQSAVAVKALDLVIGASALFILSQVVSKKAIQ